MDDLEDRLDTIYENILDYEADKVAQLVKAEVEAGTELQVILDDALISAMDEVGDLFSEGILFVPEMLMAANAMKAGMEILRPLLSASDVPSAGKIVIGTVYRDIHDIGKNLVGMMLEGGGFEVIDLGVNVSPEEFVEAASKHAPDIIGMSALLTTTMPNMPKTIEALYKANFRGKIIVGGAPVNLEFANKIGSDAYAPDASVAVSLAREMVDTK